MPVSLTRRAAIAGIVALPAWARSGGSAPVRSEVALLEAIDAALSRGGRYLMTHQRGDGSWRSEKYGAFKDGYSLTPWAVKALMFGTWSGEVGRAVTRGNRFLARLVDASGRVSPGDEGLSYPIYSAAGAAIALTFSPEPEHRRARDALIAFLVDRQLAEKNGWSPGDPSYGGWGYFLGWEGEEFARSLKPPPGRPVPELLSSNLTSTLFAASAIQMAEGDQEVLRKALTFVERCQNFSETAPDRRFDDGGFHFTPANEVQNKASVAGKDRTGRVRYRSYGSMTADGLRALLRLGLERKHPRVKAAEGWLRRHFAPGRVPGNYPQLREVQRGSAYFYYAWSAGHAFRALGEVRLDWARRLAEELLRRQTAEGAWSNPSTDLREDDPLLATAFALGALGNCRLGLMARRARPPT